MLSLRERKGEAGMHPQKGLQGERKSEKEEVIWALFANASGE